MPDYLSVSRLTKYLKLKFDKDPYLERVYLTGQVSNFRKRPSHQYFSLKDEKAVIQATMWASIYKSLGFELEEGMKVNVVGRIQLYEPSGSYSIVIEKAEPDGIGTLAVQFEQFKKKLTAAGYFDDKHKQALPRFVKKIGVITSPSGAVIKDIITTVGRRFPGVDILLYPTKVQGDGSAEEVAKNITRANENDSLDLLIVGRGGGSIEDLWSFNEEIVVQAIFESRLPIISSVGHETDTTLADFVADRRAATPTAAAELATPVTKADLLAGISERQQRLYQAMRRRLQVQDERVRKLSNSVIFRQPERLYDGYVQKLDRLTNDLTVRLNNKFNQVKQQKLLLDQRLKAVNLRERLARLSEGLKVQKRLLISNMTGQYDSKLARFEKAQDTLTTLDTSRIIARGYAMLQQDSKPVTSISQVTTGDELTVQVKDGQLDVVVTGIR